MKRGEIWTLRDRQYASKARPVIVIQNDAYDNFDSVILCLFTTYDSSEIEVRVPVIPTPENGLHDLSYVMTDKIVTVDKKMLWRNNTSPVEETIFCRGFYNLFHRLRMYMQKPG